jgi:hypothetical protein
MKRDSLVIGKIHPAPPLEKEGVFTEAKISPGPSWGKRGIISDFFMRNCNG